MFSQDQIAQPTRLVTRALSMARSGFVSAFLTSAVINVLVLASSLFSIQVYDRVLPARSLSTLMALCLMLLVAFAVQGLLEAVRARIMARVGEQVDGAIIAPAVKVIQRQALTRGAAGDGMQTLRDADQLRAFLAGPGPLTLLDLPWVPLLIGLTFLLHPWIGIVTISGAVALTSLLLITERSSKQLNAHTIDELAKRNASSDSLRRCAETTASMGLGARIEQQFLARHSSLAAMQLRLADITSSYGAASRVLRQMLQAAIVGVGAFLVIEGQATAGIMFAASILTGRTLLPIESAIGHWRQLQAARQSLARLDAVLIDGASVSTTLPIPTSHLAVRNLAVVVPGAKTPTVAGIDFQLNAGEVLMIAGPSGCGKSTLARAVLGIVPSAAGEVRIDGATLSQWSLEDKGTFTGYLPQTVELLEGSIAENIARFSPEANSTAVITAAKAAGVHDMIVALPEGYDTVVGPNGMQLSGGQKQRVGLARALFGKPFLIVLDEPNAALDGEGEAALSQAILTAKKSGSIVLVIAHRSSVLPVVDKILVLGKGQQVAFGPRREVLEKMRLSSDIQRRQAAQDTSAPVSAAS